MNRYCNNLEKIYEKTNALYRGFMLVSSELAELIKSMKGLTEEQLAQRALEHEPALEESGAGGSAQAGNAGGPQLDIF